MQQSSLTHREQLLFARAEAAHILDDANGNIAIIIEDIEGNGYTGTIVNSLGQTVREDKFGKSDPVPGIALYIAIYNVYGKEHDIQAAIHKLIEGINKG